MYIPTKSELEELRFSPGLFGDMKFDNPSIQVEIDAVGNFFSGKVGFKNHMGHVQWKEHFYPESLEDIKTLIRLLTPQ